MFECVISFRLTRFAHTITTESSRRGDRTRPDDPTVSTLNDLEIYSVRPPIIYGDDPGTAYHLSAISEARPLGPKRG